MIPRIGSLSAGSKGFDCNSPVSMDNAKLFKQAGYSFVIRYVRRGPSHTYDLTTGEVIRILDAGLGLMIVQHVGLPGWRPVKELGSSYGSIAANEAAAVGYLHGATLWCDLEGVHHTTDTQDVIDYCNAWYDSVRGAGFEPGLYVGDSCILTAVQLYRKLKFRRYWSAYNLDKDNYPSVRGVQMRQLPYPPPAKRVGRGLFEYDEDVIQTDALGGTPILLLP